ncbi:pilin [Patescibacteria group bacterium]|nr:pilin [Patescibacteria group bacterium]
MKLFNGITKLLIVSSCVFMLALTPMNTSTILVVHAQDAKAAPCTANAGGAPCKGGEFGIGIKFSNPLKVNTIQDAIKLFVNAIVRIAIPIIVVFFLWSGLSFILARGNPEKITKARATFFYTVIGTLLILGAWTITNAIIGTVNSLTS